MATVMIRFDNDGVPVVTGDVPPDDRTPISAPTPTVFVTNKAFMVAEGVYCFGLKTAVSHTPLWQVVQAVDGERAEITFHRTQP